MAGTITSQLIFSAVNGNYNDAFSVPASAPEVLTQTTEGGGNPGYVNVGTSEEDIAFGDVTPKVIIMENMDAANNVEWGPKSGGSMVPLGEIAPGSYAKFSLKSGVVLRMKAVGSAVNVRIRGYNA
jgi:hypothetical protein